MRGDFEGTGPARNLPSSGGGVPKDPGSFLQTKTNGPERAERAILVAAVPPLSGPPAPAPARPPRFLGVDTGEWCYLAVRELADPKPPRRARWVHFERCDIASLIERCLAVRNALGVEACVVDAAPYRLEARQVQDQEPEATFLWSHTEAAMRTPVDEHLGVERKRVLLNREELLAELVDEVTGLRAQLPTPRTGEEQERLALVAAHLKNLRRRLEVRAGGRETFVFEQNENHFGLAMAYARLAEELALAEGLLVPHAGGYAAPAGSAAAAAGRPSAGEPGLVRPVLADMGWDEDPGSYARGLSMRGGWR